MKTGVSLWLRSALAVTLSVGGISIIASYAAFKGMLWTEDAVLERVLGAAFDCSASSDVIEFECLGLNPPNADYEGDSVRLVELDDVDFVVDEIGPSIPTERFEVLDPLESTIGALTIIAITVLVSVALAGALLLIKRALHPVTSLEAILRDSPPDDLPKVLASLAVPVEVEGLRARLVEA